VSDIEFIVTINKPFKLMHVKTILWFILRTSDTSYKTTAEVTLVVNGSILLFGNQTSFWTLKCFNNLFYDVPTKCLILLLFNRIMTFF